MIAATCLLLQADTWPSEMTKTCPRSLGIKSRGDSNTEEEEAEVVVEVEEFWAKARKGTEVGDGDQKTDLT